MTELLKLTNVSRHFGGLKVLQDVSFGVRQGAISGLIGPNGAGKTTVFNLITGLLPPTTGDIAFDGATLLGRKPHEITRSGVARTFQNIRIFKEMTLLENVIVGMHRHLGYGVPGLMFALPRYRAVANGLILVLIVLFLPKGLWNPAWLRRVLGLGRKGGQS